MIRSTQFMEFLGGIAAKGKDGNTVRLSPGLFQAIAADDVAPIVTDVALAPPRNGIVEIAGPERAPLNEIADLSMPRPSLSLDQFLLGRLGAKTAVVAVTRHYYRSSN
jgi:uncharacterized protein YbjT (DUF2867 family)